MFAFLVTQRRLQKCIAGLCIPLVAFALCRRHSYCLFCGRGLCVGSERVRQRTECKKAVVARRKDNRCSLKLNHIHVGVWTSGAVAFCCFDTDKRRGHSSVA